MAHEGHEICLHQVGQKAPKHGPFAPAKDRERTPGYIYRCCHCGAYNDAAGRAVESIADIEFRDDAAVVG